MKRFVIGDIHGRYRALKEVLNKCKFDYDNDKLIVLGDVVDGGFNTYMVIEELLKIKNLIFIIGNHDVWFMDHIRTGWSNDVWLLQGGKSTINSYKKHCKLNFPQTHIEFFDKGKYYYVEDNMCFVHGGFNLTIGLKNTTQYDLLWDRELIWFSIKNKIPKFKKVFVGHTTTQTYGNLSIVKDCMAPIKFNNLIMMDCGAGWNGKLAIMNIDTEEYWVSKIQKPSSRVIIKEK